MKILLFLVLLSINFSAYSQLGNKINQLDTVYFVYADWTYIYKDGSIIYCGLSDDDDQTDYSYFQDANNSSIMFCIERNKLNNEVYQGLFEKKLDSYGNTCWIQKGLWIRLKSPSCINNFDLYTDEQFIDFNSFIEVEVININTE